MRFSRAISVLLPALLPLVIHASSSLVSPRSAQVLGTGPDSDQDGLSDALEQSLLEQFSPTFMIAEHDCSGIPGRFLPGSIKPVVVAEDGTIYGQVFPAKTSTAERPVIEIHYYHLWARDCGEHSHALDTEHVSTLVRTVDAHAATLRWKADYWYAAAHENTVCDVSQITRASSIHAEQGGATVWVSPGKHASYLNPTLCQGATGCGADQCSKMVALHTEAIINLGEREHPMHGSVFLRSNAWPLAGKMETTDFPENPVARLDALPSNDIAWVNPGRHPAQGVIAVSSTTAQSLNHSSTNTTNAIALAGQSTGSGLSAAGGSTDNALAKTYHHTTHALGTSAHHVGSALHLKKKPDTEP